jgi:hypothetical protein
MNFYYLQLYLCFIFYFSFVRSTTRGNMVSTLRGKATNIASRGSRAKLIPGFRSDLPAGSTFCGKHFGQNIEKLSVKNVLRGFLRYKSLSPPIPIRRFACRANMSH